VCFFFLSQCWLSEGVIVRSLLVYTLGSLWIILCLVFAFAALGDAAALSPLPSVPDFALTNNADADVDVVGGALSESNYAPPGGGEGSVGVVTAAVAAATVVCCGGGTSLPLLSTATTTSPIDSGVTAVKTVQVRGATPYDAILCWC
jgi:hypothetical protein